MYTRTFRFIHTAITLSAFFGASAVFADESSSWLEQQRSISDGYSAPNARAQVEGRQGFKSTGNPSWLDRQLSISDGYSPSNEAAARKSVYVGAKLESSQEDLLRGIRITDGVTE